MTDARPLIVHIVFRFDYGGLENGMVNLVNGSVNGKFRHAIVALTESTEFSRRLHDDVPVYALHKRAGKDFGAYWRLLRLLRRLKPAAVHTRNFGTLDCAVVAYLAGVPVRIHGEHGWDVFDPDGTKRKYRVMRQVLSRFVQAFVTVSDDLRRWLVAVVGIPERKVTRIANGVDTEKFRPARAGEPSALPAGMFGPDAVVIGSVTRFAAIKDPLNLVEAFIAARSSAAPGAAALRLVMVGDGELRAAALARLEHARLARDAWLPGSSNDVAALLRSMHVFVLGSLREGISNTILEAMASGLPVIATSTGGNTELVTPAETGMLVPPGDAAALAAAIGDYGRDASLRSRHGRLARERAVAQFSIAAMLANYQKLYDHNLTTAEV
jgi:sugar transferase (PEP-CTERM/EpsH1 system associated)